MTTVSTAQRPLGRLPARCLCVLALAGAAQAAGAADLGVCGSANPLLGYVSGLYGGSHASLHRDGRNSDFADCEIADDFANDWRFSSDPHLLAVKPVIGPNNIAWLAANTYVATKPDPVFLHGLDVRTGEPVVKLRASHGLNATIGYGQPVIDVDGNIYFGQELTRDPALACRFEGEAVAAGELCGDLLSVDGTGQIRWRIRIDGSPISAQWTPDGKLLVQSWRGTTYVVEPDPAVPDAQRVLSAQNHFPVAAATLPDYPVPRCVFDGQGSTCLIANTPSVDPVTGTIYNIVLDPLGSSDPEQPDARLRRWTYDRDTHVVSLDPTWGAGLTITGGSASSPDLSFTGRELFLNDAVKGVYAIDTDTGTVLAKGEIPYTPGGSLVSAPRLNRKGEIVGAYLSFNMPINQFEADPWLSIVHYQPPARRQPARFKLKRRFDGRDDPAGIGWFAAGGTAGGIVDKNDLSPRIRLISLATKVCPNDCENNGGLFMLVIDFQSAKIISETFIPDVRSASPSIASDGSVILSHAGSLLMSRLVPQSGR